MNLFTYNPNKPNKKGNGLNYAKLKYTELIMNCKSNFKR